MTFLNATLLFAVAAIGIPVLLHLISRREPKKVVFPSIRFLTKKFESQSSKLRVRRWWLLALRMAALAALAIALARPAIHRSLSITWLTIGLIAAVGIALLVMATVALFKGKGKGLSWALGVAAAVTLLSALLWGGYTWAFGKKPSIDNSAPAAIAIILDNSPSSHWKTAEDDRSERIKSVARSVIAQLPPTSRIAIVDRSATPVTFALDVASAVSKVDQLRPLEVTQPISSRIDAAARLVRSSELENRQLLLVTDLTKTTWDDSRSDPQLPATLAESPAVGMTVFDLGDFTAINRSLSLPLISDATPARGEPVPVSTTLQVAQAASPAPGNEPNQGSQSDQSNETDQNNEAVSITAELALYDIDPSLPVVRDDVVVRPKLQSVDRTSLSLKPGSSGELLLTIPPLDIGVHHGVIRLVGEDALVIDDTRHFSVNVMPASRVLLIADDVDEAYTISQVISPLKEADDPNAEYLIERIAYADLPAVKVSDFAAAILLDPPARVLADETLAKYVNEGGSVLICMGQAAGEEEVLSPHLPKLVRRWRSPEPHTFFDPLQTSHPILGPFAEFPDVPWGDYRVKQYWQTEPADGDFVLIRYAGTEHPAVLLRQVDRGGENQIGQWVIITTPLPDVGDQSKQWNELFGANPWPAFILVRQIVETITRRSNQSLMQPVGQPQVLPLVPVQSIEPSRRLQLFPPGKSTPVPINVATAAKKVAIGDVAKSGTYWLRGAGENAGFSANLATDAELTQRVDHTSLDHWLGVDAYQVVSQEDEIEMASAQAAQRVSLRSPIMLLALAIFLLELILGNRFYRSGRSGSARSTQSGSAKQSGAAA